MSSTPDSPNSEASEPKAEQTALACYLRTVVAIGNSVAEICPPVGAIYRERLLKLPRRLGFGATPQVLEQSREAVETDLLEYTKTAGAWIQNGSNHAASLLDQLRTTEETLSAAADLERAFLDDMADQMQVSAEVDTEAQLRASFVRYASGLRAYCRRTKTDTLAMIAELVRCREEIEAWLSEEAVSSFTDPSTGLLNRAAAERRLETEISRQRPFCVLSVGWNEVDPMPAPARKACEGQIMTELADRLGTTIRPYDLIFRWSDNQLITIFQAPESGIATRTRQIAAWLGNPDYAVDIEGNPAIVKTRTFVSLVEHKTSDSPGELVARIELAAHPEAVESGRS